MYVLHHPPLQKKGMKEWWGGGKDTYGIQRNVPPEGNGHS